MSGQLLLITIANYLLIVYYSTLGMYFFSINERCCIANDMPVLVHTSMKVD